jgi:hypothetical protein
MIRVIVTCAADGEVIPKFHMLKSHLYLVLLFVNGQFILQHSL